MARNDDADGISSIRQSHRAGRAGRIRFARQFRRTTAFRHRESCAALSTLSAGIRFPTKFEFDVEFGEFAGEIGGQLFDGPRECADRRRSANSSGPARGSGRPSASASTPNRCPAKVSGPTGLSTIRYRSVVVTSSPSVASDSRNGQGWSTGAGPHTTARAAIGRCGRSGATASPGSPACSRGDSHTQVGGREGIRIAQPPHRDDLGGPRPDPGQGQQLGAGLLPVASGDRAPPRRRPCAATRAVSEPRVRGERRGAPGSMSASWPTVGKVWVRPPAGSLTAVPYALTRRPAWVRAAFVDTCWPRTVRTANSCSSTVRGIRCPGALATTARRSPSELNASTTASGSASRSSSRRHRAIAVARSRTCSSTSVQLTWSGRGVRPTMPYPHGRLSVRRYAPSRTSSHPGTAVAARCPNTPSYANGVRTGKRRVNVWPPSAGSCHCR